MQNISELTEVDWEIILGMADSDLNVSETARKLFMCRNTVDYHVLRIVDKTGLNPRKFHDMMKLLALKEDADKIELKPCPFCGEHLKQDNCGNWEHPNNDCILSWLDSEYGRIFISNDEDDIEAWNRRVGDAE